ncbi:alpha/beta hydrolase [Gammaproteobacteria bacterium]|nr:alpha/beta hydrolase [Gammaproteobacteria bacterium]
MKYVSLFLIFLISSIRANAESAIDIRADVVYGHKDGMAMIYDVLTPSNHNGAGIIFVMSGGYYSVWGEPETRARQFSDMLDAGFAVIPLYHGSSPKYLIPEIYEDVSRAVRHIHINAEQYGIDAERIGVTGGSAGGHLSLLIGLDSDQGDSNSDDTVMRSQNSVAAVVAYYPPTDFRGVGKDNYEIINEVPEEELLSRFPALDFDRSLLSSLSPITFADELDPPTLLIHGDADPLVHVSHSIALQEEFEEQGTTSKLIIIPGAKHGFGRADGATASSARLEWFQEHLLD